MKNNRRYLESMAPLIDNNIHSQQKVLWLSSPSDIGVRRNNGRNGSRYAPTSIINCFKKLSNLTSHKEHLIGHQTVSSQLDEKVDFHKAQLTSSKNIQQCLQESKANKLLHIGGGHDHAYPLMLALEAHGIEELVILNCDAHLDTRVDDIRHSGTPFRDFTNETKIKVHLHQYGIHQYANSVSTMSELKNCDMHITYKENCSDIPNLSSKINWENPKLALFFSLDTDALDGSLFEGVSAVNHDGLSLQLTNTVMQSFFGKSPNAMKILGIYEYNPLYDNLSQKGARALSSLIYRFINI